MWYEADLAIPAGTAKNAPAEVRLHITTGVIHHVLVESAPGCHRQAAVRVYLGEHQIAPTNPEEDFALDGVPRDYQERIPVLGPPLELIVRGYAPDAGYAHTYRVGVGILPLESFPEFAGLTGRLQRFLAAVGIK